MVMNIDSGGAAAPAMVGGGTLDGLDTLATRDISTAGRGQEAGFAAPNTSATATASPSAQTPGEGGASAPAPEQDAAACRLPARGWRDVDGDGCAEEILITSGSVLVDGVGYPIGEAGDQVAVGDWDCDGVATVALVQSGGRVYVFDGWPDSTTLDGRLVADLTPPVLLADATRGRCHELVVRYAAGIWHLPLPTAQN